MDSRITKSIFILMTLIMSCASEDMKKEDEIAQKISSMFNADSYNLEQTKTEDAFGNEIRSTVLTLDLLKSKYKKQKVTSTSAMVFFNEIDQSKCHENDSVMIILKTAEYEYKKGYSVKDLRTADTLMKQVVKFINSFQTVDSVYIRELTDTVMIPDSNLEKTAKLFSSLNLAYGNVTSITTTGFSYNQSTETGQPILVLWIEVNNDKNVSFCTFYISLIAHKIIYYNISSSEND